MDESGIVNSAVLLPRCQESVRGSVISFCNQLVLCGRGCVGCHGYLNPSIIPVAIPVETDSQVFVGLAKPVTEIAMTGISPANQVKPLSRS